MNKLVDLRDSVANLPNGIIVGLGGNTLNRAPMSYVREMVRQGKKDLRLIKTAGGLDVDLLCLADCVREVDAGFIGFETKYGLANNYRRGVQSGKIKANEHACYTVMSALRAAIAGLSFMPVKGLVNSDLIEANDYFRKVTCPFTGEVYAAVSAIRPDVTIVHVQEADVHGNASIAGPNYDDITLAKASKKVIVVTEQLRPDTYFNNKAEQVDISHLLVDEVIHVPQGAAPCACHGKYDVADANMKKYLAIQNRDDLAEYLKGFELRDYAGRKK